MKKLRSFFLASSIVFFAQTVIVLPQKELGKYDKSPADKEKKEFIHERSPIERVTPIASPDPLLLIGEEESSQNKTLKMVGKKWLIDRIEARVENALILKSDLKKPRIAKEGASYTLDEAITEEIFLHRARQFNIYPSDTDIERQIASAKAEHALSGGSDEDFKREVEAFGVSFNEYKDQIARLMAIDYVKRAELGQKITITAQEIEEYYQAYPQETPERYYLHLAQIPSGKERNLKELLKEKKLSWLDLGWINKDDLAQEYSFVKKMAQGQVSQAFIVKGAQRYKTIKLVDKEMPRLRSLDERYNEIEQFLFYQKRDSLFKDLQEKLRKKALITLPK